MSYRNKKTTSGRHRNWRRQEERQFEAADRLREYLKLSPQEKLAKLYSFQAKSQRSKLQKEIESGP